MRKCRSGILVLALAAMLTACAQQSDTSLTQWGTPCAQYGLSPKDCHAKFAGYADYMAQDTKTGKSN